MEGKIKNGNNEDNHSCLGQIMMNNITCRIKFMVFILGLLKLYFIYCELLEIMGVFFKKEEVDKTTIIC